MKVRFLSVALLLVGVSHWVMAAPQSPQYPYSKATVTGFVKSCVSSCQKVPGDPQMILQFCTESCQCSINRIQNTMSYADFAKETMQPNAPRIKQAASVCAQSAIQKYFKSTR